MKLFLRTPSGAALFDGAVGDGTGKDGTLGAFTGSSMSNRPRHRDGAPNDEDRRAIENPDVEVADDDLVDNDGTNPPFRVPATLVHRYLVRWVSEDVE